MTIELKSKNKSLTEAAKAVPRAPNLGEISALDPLYQGQGLRAASKKRRKRQKRAGGEADFLLNPPLGFHVMGGGVFLGSSLPV